MAEKTARLFWRVWAVAALVGTALPAARLCWPEHASPAPKSEAAANVAPSMATSGVGIPLAPAVVGDRLIAELVRAQTGPARCNLCDQLPASDDPRVTYALTSLLEQTHLSSVRACAARALSRQGTAEARSWLVELVDDAQTEVHDAALVALAAANDDAARSIVIEATHSDNREIRLSAVTALLQAHRPEGFDAALAVLPTLEDRDALLALVDALGESHDARAVPVFLALFEGGERQSHVHAIDALGKLGSALAVPVLEPLLESGSDDEFSAAADALLALEPNAVFAQFRRLLETGDETHQRLALSAILSSKDPDSARVAHEQLRSKDSARARLVLQHLLRLPDPSFEADLTELSTTGTLVVRRTALRALRRLETPSAIASADRIEGSSDDPILKSRGLKRSLQVLAQDPSPATQAELLHSIEDSPEVSSELAAIIAFAPASTVERVVQMESGFGLESRRALIEALAQRGDPRFAPALRAALGEPDAQLHAAALRGLVGVGDTTIASDVARLTHANDDADRSLAVELLSARTDDAATREISALAADSSMEVVCSALRALEPRSPELVLQLATRAFRAGSSDARLNLLGNLNGLPQSVLRPLNELALAEGEDSVAAAAAQGLASLEGPESAQRLLAVASDSHRSAEVRAAAAQGLRQLGGPLARSNRTLLDTLSPADDTGAYSCGVAY